MSSSSFPRIPWFTRRPLLNRSQVILATLTRHGLGWLLTQLEAGRSDNLDPRKLIRHARRSQAEEFVTALIELGPTFIKFGQALSTRADLLPPSYIDALSRLQDEIPPIPYEKIHTVLVTELGKDIPELFAAFDPQPIASASIGQVYAARLWTGEEVVVKVVRPGTEAMFEQDLEILTDMAEWATQHTPLGKMYNLPVLIEEFAHTVRAEFDYLSEARNVESFARNFKHDPAIYIPTVFWDHTTRHVITLERVSGLKINDLAGLDAAGIDRREVAENLMHFALRQIFEFGLYHADPHAGNFFVQPDASLAVIDFGMVGRLNQHLKRTFLGVAQAIERKDTDILVDEMLSAGIVTHVPDRKALTRDIERLFERLAGVAIQDLSAGKFLRDLFAIVWRNGLQLPGELVAMTRAITISEGTGTLLYPNFEMVSFAAPYVRRFWKAERSPASLGPRLTAAALDSFEMSLDLPRRFHRLLSQVERGQLEVNLNHQLLDDLIGKLQKMTNRMALAMILSAVIIALSLVLVVYRPQTWQSFGNYLFFFAFLSSIIFGAWLIYSIIRSGRT
jgi:ubiquinone biosynthesis protein